MTYFDNILDIMPSLRKLCHYLRAIEGIKVFVGIQDFLSFRTALRFKSLTYTASVDTCNGTVLKFIKLLELVEEQKRILGELSLVSVNRSNLPWGSGYFGYSSKKYLKRNEILSIRRKKGQRGLPL